MIFVENLTVVAAIPQRILHRLFNKQALPNAVFVHEDTSLIRTLISAWMCV